MNDTKTCQQKFQFVVFAPNDWCGQWMNRQQLFSRIGQHFDVIYSIGMFYSWDVSSSEFKKAPLFADHSYHENVTVVTQSKWPLRIPRFPLLDSWLVDAFSKRLLALDINIKLYRTD